MSDDTVHPLVELLIKRYETHPDEFVGVWYNDKVTITGRWSQELNGKPFSEKELALIDAAFAPLYAAAKRGVLDKAYESMAQRMVTKSWEDEQRLPQSATLGVSQQAQLSNQLNNQLGLNQWNNTTTLGVQQNALQNTLAAPYPGTTYPTVPTFGADTTSVTYGMPKGLARALGAIFK